MGVSEYRCTLITDSCCDLPRETVDRYGIEVLAFPFMLDDTEHLDDLGDSLSHSAFYAAMRDGALPTTAQVPMTAYLAAFGKAAEAGVPAVFLSFTSALSGTFDSAFVAREAVLADHPDAEIHIVDSCCASTAQALLVLEAGRLHETGATAAGIAAWAEGSKQLINGYFTLETLEHLRRGGRISDVAASAGAVLDVRPVLKLDREGALVIDKLARGRKKSLRAVADIFAERADHAGNKTVVIAHADCESDAHALEELLRARADVREVVHLEVGPVIGAHTGPGMVACVFWGMERER
jgi:DegV family protein with EDD domain